MISDRCPRSSTRRSSFLALAHFSSFFFLNSVLSFTSLSLSFLPRELPLPSRPSYFHAPCLSSPPRRPPTRSPISSLPDHAARCRGCSRYIRADGFYLRLRGNIPVLWIFLQTALIVGDCVPKVTLGENETYPRSCAFFDSLLRNATNEVSRTVWKFSLLLHVNLSALLRRNRRALKKRITKFYGKIFAM